MKEFKVPAEINMESCMDLSIHFASVLIKKEEGLIVKGNLSHYSPGVRGIWHKVG